MHTIRQRITEDNRHYARYGITSAHDTAFSFKPVAHESKVCHREPQLKPKPHVITLVLTGSSRHEMSAYLVLAAAWLSRVSNVCLIPTWFQLAGTDSEQVNTKHGEVLSSQPTWKASIGEVGKSSRPVAMLV